MSRIVLTGATGFLGQPLVAALRHGGHQMVVLTRRPRSAEPGAAVRFVAWNPDGAAGPWAAEIDGADAVINLAGESIAGHRWTAEHKRRIRDSRVNATRSIAAAITGAARRPALLINGSAVGYYGSRGDQRLTEESPPGTDFLADVCVQWEEEAARAAITGTRVVCVRTGIVLERDGGALPQMLPPFRVGAGGPVGSGAQYWPWIHRQDWINLVLFLLAHPSASGAVNATAPNPVPNREFARELGRAMHRPALLPTPGFALKLLLGEMADALLLSGQRALPAKAERLGYAFRFPHLDAALEHLFPA